MHLVQKNIIALIKLDKIRFVAIVVLFLIIHYQLCYDRLQLNDGLVLLFSFSLRTVAVAACSSYKMQCTVKIPEIKHELP